MKDPRSFSSSGAIRVDGSELDVALPNCEFMTRTEILKRRSRQLKQLTQIYRDHYWALMEELRLKHREYYREHGKSPFIEDNGRTDMNDGDYSAVIVDAANYGNLGGNTGNRCGVRRCKAKAMALTRFCYTHILSDSNQKLYKACSFPIQSSAAGPILCGKTTLRSTVPSYCSSHFKTGEKIMARALKNKGLSVSSTNKLAPKFHAIIAEYVRQIQIKRRASQKEKTEIAEVKDDNTS